MAIAFARTLRALHADGGNRQSVVFLLAGALLAAWSAWFFFARVTVWEVTDAARLEVDAAAHHVAAPVAGQLVRTDMVLGRRVAAGDVLAELDAAPEHLQLEAARTRIDDARARLEAIEVELVARREALVAHDGVRELRRREAEARVHEARARAEQSERRTATLEELERHALVTEDELFDARSDSVSQRSLVEAVQWNGARGERESEVERRDREAEIAELKREAVELSGQIAIEESACRLLDQQLSLRVVRAPVAGCVGETRNLRPGAVVTAGALLGSIVPDGETRAVAQFPAHVLGRIRPGQRALLRLEGFPWSRFGTLGATVASVASEPGQGGIQVQLALVPGTAPAVPREHGLPGRAEVAVERITPAELLLRSIGESLFPREPTAPDPTGGSERSR